MNPKTGKTLRIVAVVFFGFTAAMNILGGAGTVCAAFLTRKYPPMWALYDYQWLYQLLMITTILVGIAGIWVLVSLLKRRMNGYRNGLILLVIGSVLAGIQVGASLILRGKAVPANMKLYINVLTLIIFLVLRLPKIWEKVNFNGPSDKGENSLSGGLAALVSGVITLTTFYWAGPSHTYLGENWVEKFELSILGFGVILVLCGLVLISHWIALSIRTEYRRLMESQS